MICEAYLLLNYRIGFYYNNRCRNASYYMSIYDWLQKSQSESIKTKVNQARMHKLAGENDIYRAIKDTLPCTMYTMHANGSKSIKDMTELLPFVVLDVDHIEENEVENMKKKLFDLPYILLSSKSVSGLGVWALAYIEFPEKSKETLKSIAKDLMKIGIKIDDNTMNVNRLRYISYDENVLVKPAHTEIEAYSKYVQTEKLKPKSHVDSLKKITKVNSTYDTTWTKEDPGEVSYIEHQMRWRLFNSLSRICKDEKEFKEEWEWCCDHLEEANGHTTQWYKDLFDKSDWKSLLTGNEYIDRELLEKFGYTIKFKPTEQ